MHRRKVLALGATLAVALSCGGGGGSGGGSSGSSGPSGGDSGGQHGIQFGTQGPWPVANVTYGSSDGILESPVVGVTTDEAENRWVATHDALYLMRPTDKAFRRYDAADGLHLPSNPARYCDDRPIGPTDPCNGSLTTGAAAPPGISTIVGGGPDEVFVGYYGIDEFDGSCPPKDPIVSEGFGDYCDPNRHSGKIDRVRVAADGTLEVVRFDLLSGHHGAEYWHNRTIQSLAYDHFAHPHTLYAGTNHGVDIFFPDKYRPARPGEWFDLANVEWMGDHLHAQVCVPPYAPCASELGQRMGDWHGIAIDANGDLWHAGRWTAGLITWDPDPLDWFERNGAAFKVAFGDPYPAAPNAEGFQNEPVFKVATEGDSVYLSGVAVCPDGRVWFSSFGNETGRTVAVWSGKSFQTFDATSLGAGDAALVGIACLPDGRVALATRTAGVVLYDPSSRTSKALHGGAGIPSDDVQAIEVDRMVSPPALHVATGGGAAVLRVLP